MQFCIIEEFETAGSPSQVRRKRQHKSLFEKVGLEETKVMSEEEMAQVNTDRELWRRNGGDPMDPDNFYQPSIHVTEGGGIGIQVGGHVFVKTPERWHELVKRGDFSKSICGCVMCEFHVSAKTIEDGRKAKGL